MVMVFAKNMVSTKVLRKPKNSSLVILKIPNPLK